MKNTTRINEFVAGDTAELSKHGVHAEYLPILQDLKEEIKPYLDWAQPKVEAGAAELTLCSPRSTCISSRHTTADCVRQLTRVPGSTVMLISFPSSSKTARI